MQHLSPIQRDALLPMLDALKPKVRRAVVRHLLKESIYLPMDCPRCTRRRVEFDGVQVKCEKCGWLGDHEQEADNG